MTEPHASLGRAAARRYLHLLTSGLLIVVAAVYLYLALHIRVPPLGDPLGPRLYPMTLAILLLIFSAIALAFVILTPKEEDDSAQLSAQARAWVTLGLMAAFALALPYAGFLASTAVFAFVALSLLRFRTLPVNLLTAALIAGAFHLIFRVWLGVPLPDPVFW